MFRTEERVGTPSKEEPGRTRSLITLGEDEIDEALRERLTEEQGEAQWRTPDFCTEWVKEQFSGMLQPVRSEEGYGWALGIGTRLEGLETAAASAAESHRHAGRLR